MTSATNLCTLVLSLGVYLLTLRFWPKEIPEFDRLIELRFALAVVMTTLVSFHLYSYDGTLLAIPLILMLNHYEVAQQQSPKAQWIFLLLLIVIFLPLLPNVLLSEAVLAWWALPVPVVFWVIAAELRRQTRRISAIGRY